METVQQMLMGKGQNIWSVTPDTTVYDALKIMAEKDIGALVVLEGNKVAGIFSERDYARRVILQGKNSRDIPVSEIMVRNVYTVSPKNTVDECMALMTAKRIRHLPVTDEGKMVGMISIGDVVKSIIAKQDFHIAQLTNYITGTSRPLP